MTAMQIKTITCEGDNLTVVGLVDGALVTGHGWVAHFNRQTSDSRKISYLNRLLTEGAVPSVTSLQIHMHLRESLLQRAWNWMSSRWEHIGISIVVFILGQTAKHYFLAYLPQISHILHVNLAFLK